MKFIIIEDTECGKFLDLLLGQNGHAVFHWEALPENATVLPYTKFIVSQLDSFGLAGKDYIWHECDQDGRFV